MKMTATIELEFESAGETTHNAMDAALIRGLGKERHRTKRDRDASEKYQVRLYKMESWKESPLLACAQIQPLDLGRASTRDRWPLSRTCRKLIKCAVI